MISSLCPPVSDGRRTDMTQYSPASLHEQPGAEEDDSIVEDDEYPHDAKVTP